MNIVLQFRIIQVRLENCTFANNKADHLLVAYDEDDHAKAQFFSDESMPVHVATGLWSDSKAVTKSLELAPKRFITGEDPWIQDLHTVRFHQ